MAAECLIHFVTKVSDAARLTNFTDVSFNRFLEFRKIWLGLDGQQKEVAFTTINTIPIETEDAKDCTQYAYHRKCYSFFTNISLVRRAEARINKAKELIKAKELQESAKSSNGVSECNDEPTQKKRLRLSSNGSSSNTLLSSGFLSNASLSSGPQSNAPPSNGPLSNSSSCSASSCSCCTCSDCSCSDSSSSTIISRNEQELPNEPPPTCIICRKENLYYTDRFSKKRVLDKLVSAKTPDGGQLRKVAELRNDENILLEIQGKNCIDLEVKYHRRCYGKYTREYASKDRGKSKKYQESFKLLCEQFIQARIINNEEIFYMKKIQEIFVEIVSVVENEDASDYGMKRLKQRIQERFPRLVFQATRMKDGRALVYYGG